MTTSPNDEPAAEPEKQVGEELPPEQETRIVDRVVDKVKDLVDTLVGGGDDPGGGGGDGPSSPEAEPEPSSPRDVEAHTEELVRKALGTITAEEEHAQEHQRIKEAERPPQTLSRLTRAIWGADE